MTTGRPMTDTYIIISRPIIKMKSVCGILVKLAVPNINILTA